MRCSRRRRARRVKAGKLRRTWSSSIWLSRNRRQRGFLSPNEEAGCGLPSLPATAPGPLGRRPESGPHGQAAIIARQASACSASHGVKPPPTARRRGREEAVAVTALVIASRRESRSCRITRHVPILQQRHSDMAPARLARRQLGENRAGPVSSTVWSRVIFCSRRHHLFGPTRIRPLRASRTSTERVALAAAQTFGDPAGELAARAAGARGSCLPAFSLGA